VEEEVMEARGGRVELQRLWESFEASTTEELSPLISLGSHDDMEE
jgi:hypothetical protein